MRQGILAITGDPFLFRWWLRSYDKFIAPNIDQLYVGQWGPADPAGIAIINKLCKERNIQLNIDPNPDNHAFNAGHSYQQAYNILEKHTDPEDTVVFLQTDGFVFDSTIVDEFFTLIETDQYQLIGEKKEHFLDWPLGQPLSGIDSRYESRHPAFQPCFLFSKSNHFHLTQDLIKQDIDQYFPGQFYKISTFNVYRGNEECALFTSLLRKQVLEEQVYSITQERGHPGNVEKANENFRWFHYGCIDQMPLLSMSDRDNIPVIREPKKDIKNFLDLKTKYLTCYQLLPHFVGLYKTAVITADIPELVAIQARRLEAIEYAIDTFKYDVEKFALVAQEVPSWDDKTIEEIVCGLEQSKCWDTKEIDRYVEKFKCWFN